MPTARTTASDKTRQRQLRLAATGRCITCGRPVESERAGRRHCASCSAVRYAREREVRLALVAEGLCERCRAPREPERKIHRRCASCAADLREAIETSKARREAKCQPKEP